MVAVAAVGRWPLVVVSRRLLRGVHGMGRAMLLVRRICGLHEDEAHGEGRETIAQRHAV